MIFSDTINVINVKLCMLVVFIEFYLLINFQVKNWLAVFKVRVTARAYIVRIWLFLLHLLHCWPFCSQSWFDGAFSHAGVSCEKKRISVFKVKPPKVTVKIQNVHACLTGQHLLNLLLPNLVQWCVIMNQSEKTGLLFSMSRSQRRLRIIKLWLTTMSSELLILLQPYLVRWH